MDFLLGEISTSCRLCAEEFREEKAALSFCIEGCLRARDRLRAREFLTSAAIRVGVEGAAYGSVLRNAWEVGEVIKAAREELREGLWGDGLG